MINYEDKVLQLRFAEHSCLAYTHDEDAYADEQEGSIWLYNCALDPEDRVEIKVGEFSYTIIDTIGANVNQVSVYEVFDLWQGTYEIFQALYDPETWRFKRDTMLATSCAPKDYKYQSPNLIYFDKLVIYPEFAHKGFGLSALRKLLHYRQRGSMAVIDPYPQQFYAVKSAEEARTNAMALGVDPDASEVVAREKLIAHFARLGFSRVSGTPYLVRAAHQRLPSEAVMLGPQLPVAKPASPNEIYQSFVARVSK